MDGPLHLLEIRLQAIQLSPISHGPLGASLHTPGHDHRFAAMLLFPYVFRLQVRHQTQERTSEFLPATPGIRQDASWRTMLLFPRTFRIQVSHCDPGTSLRVPPGLTGDTTKRLTAHTGHEVLPHPAFPWAVDRPHSPTPPGLATGPSDSRGSSTVSAVLAVVVAHPARGPSLRRVMLSRRSSLLLPPPTSARRSTISRVTLIGFAVTGAPEGGTLRTLDAGVETDLSCSTMGCVIVPLPIRRRVSGAARPRSSHRPWPSPR